MPMTMHDRTRIRLVDISFAFRGTGELLILFFLGLALAGAPLCAQTIQITLVNGRNGRPMGNECIQVWVGDKSKPSSSPFFQTQTDKDGVTTIRLAEENTAITQSQHVACGLSGIIDPVVKYGNTIGVRTGYALCQTRAPAQS